MTDGEFDNLTVNNELTIGSDATLYSSASNVLNTNDAFYAASRIGIAHESVVIPASTTKWVRIAETTGTERGSGLFLVRYAGQGRHGHYLVYAGIDVNVASSSTINLLSVDGYTSVLLTGRIIRYSSATTSYSSYLELEFVNNAPSGLTIYVDQLTRGTDGWNLITIEDGEIPANYVADEKTISDIAFGIGLDSKAVNIERDYGQLQLATQGSNGGIVIGGDATLYRGASNHLQTDSSLTICGNLYTLEEVKLSGDEIPHLNKIEIVNKIWKFVDGMWAPEGLVPGDSFLNFRDSDENKEKQFFLITESQGGEIEPLLATNTGFVVQKDITAGGFVGSNQGELWLGSGRDNQVDVPKIILMHSDVSRLGGGGDLEVPPVPSCVGDDEFPPSPSQGDYFFRTDQELLYKYNGSSWDNITVKGQLFVRIGSPVLLYSCISYNPQTQVAAWATSLASNYAGYFDTLYLTKSDGEDPAHLDLGNLNVHGDVLIGGDVNLYRSGPNQMKTDDSFIIGNYGSISSAGDAIFNSVLGTAATGLKVGPVGTTYVSVSRVGSTGYLTSHFGDLRLVANGTIWVENNLNPVGGGSHNMGTSSAYWNEINYKTLTDRGCPIWMDPEKATEIMKGIKPHATLKSIHKLEGKEAAQFDQNSLPPDFKPDEGNGLKFDLFVYAMYHSMRDLIGRTEELENENKLLKNQLATLESKVAG